MSPSQPRNDSLSKELLGELRVHLEQRGDDPRERLVVLDACVLAVGIPACAFWYATSAANPSGMLLGDQAPDAVGIGPGDVAELIVELT